MRLISYDGWFDIPYEHSALFIQEMKNEPGTYTILAKHEGQYYEMAYYSSEAKALSVMRQIRTYSLRNEMQFICPDDDDERINKLLIKLLEGDNE